MLFKLAFSNIKKSMKDYSIYFITLVLAVTIFYLFNSLDAQSSMLILSEDKHRTIQNLVNIIGVLSMFISGVLAFLIVYANNFLIKRRKKELGIYALLGMEKGKISSVLTIETFFIGLISLAVGLLAGVFLSQGMSLLVAKMFDSDFSQFVFVFSKTAFIKTCVYFAAIFIFVILFSLVSVSRYKLVDLIYAQVKNETVKIRNKWVCIVSFVSACIFIAIAYKILFSGVLYEMGVRFGIMIVLGCIGTFLFFYSLSGFFLEVIKHIISFYYKGLNMFIIKQINNRINTNVVSMSIVCVLLMFALSILSASVSFGNYYNADLSENNLTDFSAVTWDDYFEDDTKIIDDYQLFLNKKGFDISGYFNEYVEYKFYTTPSVKLGDFLLDDDVEAFEKKYTSMSDIKSTSIAIMKESDYNKLMELSGKEKLMRDIPKGEFLPLANYAMVVKMFNNSISKGKIITIGNDTLKSMEDSVIEVSLRNLSSAGNVGVMVVDDSYTVGMKTAKDCFIGNYKGESATEKQTTEDAVYKKCEELSGEYMQVTTKISMYESSLGIKAMLSFVGIYLGGVFMITCATILAIQQLSQSADNKERFGMLAKIGCDEKMIKRSLFTQILIFFIVPLSLSIVHTIAALNALSDVMEYFMEVSLIKNILVLLLVLIVVYGGYMYATYSQSKRMILSD